MISNDIKTRIVLAISGNRQNYATDAKHAVALGISTSVYSEPKLAIVMGTEGDGLSHKTIAEADYVVRIPMSHGVDSLNVAAGA